jgi:hypothetical protein
VAQRIPPNKSLSYGPHLGDLIQRAATYVDKILKGARPADEGAPVDDLTLGACPGG